MRGRLRIPLALAFLTGCNAFVGDYAADLAEGRTVSSVSLCSVERAEFVLEVDLESSEALTDLPAYYDEANPALVDHLTAMAGSFHNGDPGAGITYVMGAAGVGKSFAARNVISGFDDTEKCTVKVADLFREDKDLLSFPVSDSPDLATTDGSVVFNTLPTVSNLQDFNLQSLLQASGCEANGQLLPVIVIDDLDEVHGDTCRAILKEVDDFVLEGAPGAGPFVHVVVFGRPEGFYAWLGDPARDEQNNQIVDPFVLAAPHYDTAGDIEFRVKGYLDFTDQLAALEASGELDEYIASTTEAVASRGFLTYSLGNLAIGNFVVAHTAPGSGESEEQLKAGLFDDMMLRASQTHGRPEPGGPLGGPYLRLLEDIAARYVAVDEHGVFTVPSEDTMDVVDDDGTAMGKVRVRDVLNRAGLALLTSANSATSRYRFDPFWVQGHLVERYNSRVQTGYAYRPCDPQ